MARVEEWMKGFVTTHCARFPRQDWPLPTTDHGRTFWESWRYQFVLKGITLPVANEASLRLTGNPPPWLGDHLTAILETAAEITKEQASQGQGVASDPRKAALEASRHCSDCGGTGHAIRYVYPDNQELFSTAQGNPVPVGSRVGFWCGCDYGLFLARANGATKTVADYETLRVCPVDWSDEPDSPYRYPPDQWDFQANAPIPAEPWESVRDKVRMLARSARARADRPDPDRILPPPTPVETFTAPAQTPPETYDWF